MGKFRKITQQIIAFVLVCGLLVACGNTTNETKADKSAADKTTTSQQGSAEKKDTGEKVAEQITLRVVDWSDGSLKRREEFHKKFEEMNPDIKIEYTQLTIDQFKNTIITMIKSGDGPDLFPIPGGITLSTAIKEDWYQPMNNYVTKEFLGTFKEGALAEGITVVGDDVYTLPEAEAVVNTLFYYNKDILEKSGIKELPKTYDEFVEACKKISETGKGQFYGLIEGGKQVNRMEGLVRTLTAMSGGKIPATAKAFTVEGKAPFNSQEVVDAMNLLKNIKEVGGLHPDTININAPEAREMFSQGQAGFICQGMWCITTWRDTYPDLNYGVMAPPYKDEASKASIQRLEQGPWLGIYKQSKYPEQAGRYLMALFSEEYGYQSSCVADGTYLSVVKEINEKNISNQHMKEYAETAEKNSLVVPSLTVRNPKGYDFYAEVKDIQPSLGAIAQGIIAGGIQDVKPALDKLTEDSTKEWKRAAEAVGLDFAEFDFPNWDNKKTFTQDMY